MHKGFEHDERPDASVLSGGGDAALIRYEIERLAGKNGPAEAYTIEARDLHDAIGKARKVIGVGEVRIRRDGRQVCYLHLQSATRWWVELNENAG
ncbi:hypothetical protein [Aurantiacibacter sediminis]|uniref:Uncharacterized protein n=1 Tax=Aurantiacibacter sediminis TaxID=2793064 RepID=A0ABS0N2X0_9SPHN|nr:hypothetical protein [Aurantiacibacter sediminis]MBH5322309.1 hypothetical protein [Aurantiacibacter sediminis]